MTRGAQAESATLEREYQAVKDQRDKLALSERGVAASQGEPERLLWKSRLATALFWCDDARRADELAAEVLAGTAPPREAVHRAYVVRGFSSDVRGLHGQAESWYHRALAQAEPSEWAPIRLEIATSLSKQGRFAEAIGEFDRVIIEAGQGEGARSRTVLAHALSRRAVCYEVMGDLRSALTGQEMAIAEAGDDAELRFTCLCRRARTQIALRDFAAAEASLDLAAALAARVRRGSLFLAHDRARLARAHGTDPAAILEAYRVVVDLLPKDTRLLVEEHRDLWGEVVDALRACAIALGLKELRQRVQPYLAFDAATRNAPGIYESQAMSIEDAQARRARAAAGIIAALRARPLRQAFSSAGYRFDLEHGTAVSLVGGGAVELGSVRRGLDLLRALLSAPGHRLTSKKLYDHLCEQAGFEGEPGAVRQIVRTLRKRLGLDGPDQLIVGYGGPGGGYRLIVDEEPPLSRV
ncbi:MAG: hypothetical protein HYS27_09665 [Deltaproteobacteria bacterium]|nr:hypothetical protein [Deltaproteobacteria bacterium]